MKPFIQKLLKFKKSTKMKNIFTLVSFILSSAFLLAQAPQSFNYQGVARTLDGNPILNQNIGLQISILETNANGAAVYAETHTVQTNHLGLFNLHIGTGTALNGTFSDIDWGSDSHFVQIEMDENGGSAYQLIGTSQLLSVPYALYAGNGSLWKDISEMPNQYGFSSGAFYKVDSSSIIIGKQNVSDLTYPSFPRLSMYEEYTDTQFGNYAGASMLLIRNAAYHDEPTLEFAYGYAQGTDRNFSFKTNGSSKLFIEGTGHIGIGTTSPKSKLQITNGDIYIEDINRGIIMKSPNGQCWRLTMDDSGQLSSSPVICPN